MTTSQMPFVGNFNFLVEIEGVTGESSYVAGGFSEASGIASTTDVIEFSVGSSNQMLNMPGKTRYSNVVLKRGVTNSNEFYLWRQAIENGKADRRSGSIILLDHEMEERARWNFYDAWPCRYEAPELDSGGGTIGIETLELAVGRIERVQVQTAPDGEED